MLSSLRTSSTANLARSHTSPAEQLSLRRQASSVVHRAGSIGPSRTSTTSSTVTSSEGRWKLKPPCTPLCDCRIPALLRLENNCSRNCVGMPLASANTTKGMGRPSERRANSTSARTAYLLLAVMFMVQTPYWWPPARPDSVSGNPEYLCMVYHILPVGAASSRRSRGGHRSETVTRQCSEHRYLSPLWYPPYP